MEHGISLRDKFLDWTDFRVMRPTRLLNPVVKEHAGVRYGIANFRLHYAAYPLTPVDSSVEISERVNIWLENIY